MTTLIYGIVFILLLTILITIGNLVFSISEINEVKNSKKQLIKVIKTSVFVMIKIVLFALIINLIMFSFFGDELDLNTLHTQILTIFISFQIITESFSINKLMRNTVKELNKTTKPLTEYISEPESGSIFKKLIKLNQFVWMFSTVLNIITIVYLIILMMFDFTFFYQNMFIYFVMIVYIKYLTFETFYGKIKWFSKSKINQIYGN